tara:strand:- start:1767 stop:1925 length:159 start_codon:yes stop_codon:yes gene_type:complete
MEMKDWRSYFMSIGVGTLGLTLNDVLETVFLTVSIGSLLFNLYKKHTKHGNN